MIVKNKFFDKVILGLVAAISLLALTLSGCSEDTAARKSSGQQVEPVEWSAWATETNSDGMSYHLEWFPGRVFYLVQFDDGAIAGASKIDYEWENGRAYADDDEDPLMEIMTCEEDLVTLKMPDGTVWEFRPTDHVIGFDEMDRYLTAFQPIYWDTTGVSAGVTTRVKGENSDADVQPTNPRTPRKTADGYTYHIYDHDWTIGFDLDKLIGDDGEISTIELWEAIGFDRSGELRDENGRLLAKALGFDLYSNTPACSSIAVRGNLSFAEHEVIIQCDETDYSKLIRVTSSERVFYVSFNQLLLGVYGSEYYLKGVNSDCMDPYVDTLGAYSDYSDTITTYTIPD
ncbi:hypothetical protein IJ102_00075 [Candidatus Saccharibacteria bacterium]|nr:hypothetical protein [Candidatus Saccharibacteria bacterium]